MMSSGERVWQGLARDDLPVLGGMIWEQSLEAKLEIRNKHLMISTLQMIWRRADDDKQWYMYLVTREIRRYWQLCGLFFFFNISKKQGRSGVSQTLKNTGNLFSTAITFQLYFVFALNPCHQVESGHMFKINMMVFWKEVEKYSRRSITLKP